MLLPDCRHDNNYNEKFLENDEKKVLVGMDYTFELIKECFDRPEMINLFDNLFDNLDKAKRDFLFEEIKTVMNDWYEVQRNETIVAMIDTMNEDVYRKNREAVMKIKGLDLYDTIEHAVTKEKESIED